MKAVAYFALAQNWGRGTYNKKEVRVFVKLAKSPVEDVLKEAEKYALVGYGTSDLE